jgi:N-acetyl-anhydromuramyl-L-alanine amidase AmpD
MVERLISTVAQRVRGRGTNDSRWRPASSNNYTAADRPSSIPIDMIIVHVTQCSFTKAIRRFEDPSTNVSAHYTIRSSDGFIAQSVSEKDIAWHAGNWGYNRRSIGIEHEGYVEKPAFFTEAMYQSSARLAAKLCDKYQIPVDRGHLIGHSDVPHTVRVGQYGGWAGHKDPGRYFDWSKYLLCIRACLDT